MRRKNCRIVAERPEKKVRYLTTSELELAMEREFAARAGQFIHRITM